MQKNSYYPSPLRKDYTTKPVKNFIPIIVAQTSSRSGTARDRNPQDQKIIKYSDGLIVKIVDMPNIKSGIFFMDNHTTILYNIEDQEIHGKNYIVYPSGVLMSANYQQGKLNRWLVVVLEGKFIICYHYRRGIKEGEQYFYDFSDKLLIISLYSKGKLIQIKNGEIGEFPIIVKNQQVIQRVAQLQHKKFELNKNFPTLKLPQLSYYGQISQLKDTPNGFGIMIGQEQIFMGNFIKGVLNGLGAIKFQNNDFYFGQFNHGSCVGYGSIDDGKHTKYQFGNQHIQKSQFDQFIGMVSAPDRQQKWTNRFKDLQAFHHQFKNKFMWQSKQNTKSSKQNSDVNLQVAESHHIQEDSQDQQQDFSSGNEEILHSFSKHRNNNKIPMLSLAKSIKVKRAQNQTIRTGSQRANDQSCKLKIQRQQSRTQRFLDKQQDSSYLKVPEVKKQRKYATQTKKKPNTIMNNNQRYEHLGTQNIAVDKQYISKQYHFMRPNQMEIKQKMNRVVKEKLEKNWSSTKIDMGKIMKVGSDVSSEQEEKFIRNLKNEY